MIRRPARDRPCASDQIDRGAQVALLAIELAQVGLAGRRRGSRRRPSSRCRRRPRRTRLPSRAARQRARGARSAYSRNSGWRLKRVSASALRRAARGRLDPDQALVGERLETVDDVESQDPRRHPRPAPRSRGVQPPAKTLSLREQATLRAPRGARRSRRSRLAGSAVAPAGRGRRRRRSRLCPRRSQDLRRREHAGCAPRRARARAAGPPSRSAIARMAASASSSRTRPGRCSRARSRNSATPASASSGGTGWPRSPLMRSSSRLVTMSRSAGRVAGHAGDHLGAGGEQLLEVVEDEQAGPLAQVVPQRVLDALLGGLANPDGGRDRRLDPCRVADAARSTNQVPWGKASRTSRATRQREARLAAAAGPGQRDDAARLELRPDRGPLVVAPDEARDVARQVGRRIGRPERSVVVRDPEDDQPIERQRLVEVLDGAKAAVDELDIRRGPRSSPGRRAGRRRAPATARSARRCRPRRCGRRSSRRSRRSPRRRRGCAPRAAGPRPGGGPSGPGPPCRRPTPRPRPPAAPRRQP